MEQVTANLSKACDKATSPKFQITNSRLDNIEETLLDHDEETQKLMDKYLCTVNRRVSLQTPI
eukprot:11947310-Ditylum_brightwellii.AAC.1